NPLFFGLYQFHMGLGFLRIVPKIRLKCFFFFVFYFDKLCIYVKDTSLTHQGDQ
ncbi:MAG: hypothetical protein ACI9Q4_000704, partial [Sediminicola sp.]